MLKEMRTFAEAQMSTEDSMYGIFRKKCLCDPKEGNEMCCYLNRHFLKDSNKEKKEKCCQICRQYFLKDLPPTIIVGKGKLWYREKGLDNKINKILLLKQKLKVREKKIWEGFSVVTVPVTYFSVMGYWSVIIEPYVGLKDKRFLEKLLGFYNQKTLVELFLQQRRKESIIPSEVMKLLSITLPFSEKLLRLANKRLLEFKNEVQKAKKHFLETELVLTF